MVQDIFVNLPVKRLPDTMVFWKSLGFTFNPEFTDNNAGCLVMGKNIYAMLLTEKFFKTFTKKEICPMKTHIEGLFAISVSSRKKVDEMVKTAVKAGGKEPRGPQDYGWMYSRTFEDIDGHTWEVLYADISKRQ